MAKKLKAKTDTDTVSGRVAWYLQKLWRGSMTAMGQELGIHPSSLGNVIHGRRVPGREILTAIGSHPLVNSEWLMQGIGTPIRTEDQGAAEIGLPIASQPFQGLPRENPDLLEDVLYPVTRRLHRSSRYWMRIAAGHPLVLDDQLQIASGDMVLFEPLPEHWPKDLTNKPCIVVMHDDTRLLRFGRCTSQAVRGPGDVFVYATSEDAQTDKSEYQKPFRAILLDAPIQQTSTVELVAVGLFRCGPC